MSKQDLDLESLKYTDVNAMDFIGGCIVYLLKKRNKGKRRSNLYNDIGVFATKEKAEKEIESLNDERDNYKVIPFTLNRSKYHFN